MGARRSWDSYNLAKARRFMARTAELQVVEKVCQDCGGKGLDLGSLNEPEACPNCHGSGLMLSERAERRGPGRASVSEGRKAC